MYLGSQSVSIEKRSRFKSFCKSFWDISKIVMKASEKVFTTSYEKLQSVSVLNSEPSQTWGICKSR